MKQHVQRIFALTLCCLTMAGCALGPDYQKPAMDLSPAYKNTGLWKKAVPQDHLGKGNWWEMFGDSVLNDLEEQAGAANQELRAAVARVTQARAAAGIAKADFFPRAELNASAGRARTPADFSVTGQGFTSDFSRFPLDLSYEIDIWGRVRRANEAARADVQASAAVYETILLTLRADLAANYFALRALDMEAALLERTLELRREALKLVTSRFQYGDTSELDVARAKTELASTEAEAAGLRKSRGELENGIAVLVGKTASEFSLPAKPFLLLPPPVAPGLPATLLERRPDVAAAERAMAAANARIGVAKTAFFPAIRLTGSGGYESREISDLFTQSNRSWALGPSISLPIFEAGRNSSNLKRAKAAYEEAVALYRQQVLVAVRDVENSLVGLRALAEQAEAQERAVRAAQRAAELSSLRYREGLVSYLEVVDTERTALLAQQLATRILGQQLQTSVLLIKALGGSWESS